MPDVLTRCPKCLALTKDKAAGCNPCDPSKAWGRALYLIRGMSYRFYGSDLYYIANDDPDNYQTVLVAFTNDMHPQDVYERLKGARWPQGPIHLCPNCQDAEAVNLEWCDRCRDQFNLEGRGKW